MIVNMFVKRWKKKSILKHINRLLSQPSSPMRPGAISTIGIVYDYIMPNEFIGKLESLGFRMNQIKTIGLLPDDVPPHNSWDSFYYAKDFGWNGQHHNPALKTFTDENFDLLISFYKEENWALTITTAMSKANFKLGLIPSQESSFDLIIDVKIEQIDLLISELRKYLSQLNKLPNGRY